MPNSSLDQFTEVSIPALDDYLYSIPNAGGTDNKVHVSRLLGQMFPEQCDGVISLATGIPVYNPLQALVTSASAGADTLTTGAAHGWLTGTIVAPNTTSNGITVNVPYFVHVIDATTISLHTTLAAAIADTSRVDISGTIAAWLTPIGFSGQTVYFTPYKGNRISLYDGTRWKMFSFSEISLALGTLTTNTNYDVFVYDNAGTLTLELTAWASATARTTALVLQDGVWVKTGVTTRRYLGTIRMDSTTSTTDSYQKRFVWNFHHRSKKLLRKRDYTATWTYNATAFQQARAQATNQVECVVGIGNEVMIALKVVVGCLNPGSGGNYGIVSIGEDGTANPLMGVHGGRFMGATASLSQQLMCELQKPVALGYHFYPWLEAAFNTGGNITFSGSDELSMNGTGMFGSIEC
jgi:hypothetical protein